MILIGSGLVLSDQGAFNSDSPVIGYQNRVTVSNIAATVADADFPVTNLANPATNLRWAAPEESPPSASDVYLTVVLDTVEDVDYVGIAKHNFGSAGIVVSVEGLAEDGSPEDWVELVEEALPADDAPLIFRFSPQSLYAVRVRLQPGSEPPTAAVMYVGKLLVMQRRLYVGHSPITLTRQATVINGRSESGNFLGRIVTGEMTSTQAEFQNLTAAWYRANFDPFVRASKELPFFFAWRPGTYPEECGFCWLTSEPRPSNQRNNGMMQVSLQMTGIV